VAQRASRLSRLKVLQLQQQLKSIAVEQLPWLWLGLFVCALYSASLIDWI
jgi:hypothetical protein